MRKWIGAGVLAGALAVGLPEGAQAQDAGWWNWALPNVAGAAQLRASSGAVVALPLDRDEEWERRRGRGGDEDRRETRGRDRDGGLGDILRGGDERGDRARGNGPPFCRNGQGHPVHGRRWCVEKGFGLGSGLGVDWERAGWEDIVLRSPRRSGAYDRGGLIDVLGDVVFGRLSERAQRLGAAGDLDGRFFRDSGASVLQIRAGGMPIAELTDLDADGRADVVLLAQRR